MPKALVVLFKVTPIFVILNDEGLCVTEGEAAPFNMYPGALPDITQTIQDVERMGLSAYQADKARGPEGFRATLAAGGFQPGKFPTNNPQDSGKFPELNGGSLRSGETTGRSHNSAGQERTINNQK